ncbi:hypothetical protein NBRC116188_07000 [Oceaniserpentilla sp. 4NH20-0058]|uniref:hypothetical protein n=1 Tax=Oceaniserpentilla sp. 4NH20-0058 TaxID=3127660 RepID=UPI00310C7F03
MKLLKSLFILGLFAASQGAFAFCSEDVHISHYNSQLGLVGLDSESGNVFAYLKHTKENSTCGCQAARFKSKFTKPEIALEILLAAKTSRRSVRIDFNEDAAGTAICNQAVRVYLY